MDVLRWYTSCLETRNEIKALWAELRRLDERTRDFNVSTDRRAPARKPRKSPETEAGVGS